MAAAAAAPLARPRSRPAAEPIGLLARRLGRATPITLEPARIVVVLARRTNPVAWPRRPAAPRARRRRQRSQRVRRRASRGARAVAREVALRAARGTPPNSAVPPRCPAAPHSFDRLHHVARRVAHSQACLLEPLNDGIGVARLELGERTQRVGSEAAAHGLAESRRPEAAWRALHAPRESMRRCRPARLAVATAVARRSTIGRVSRDVGSREASAAAVEHRPTHAELSSLKLRVIQRGDGPARGFHRRERDEALVFAYLHIGHFPHGCEEGFDL